jgi:hypothetical protein
MNPCRPSRAKSARSGGVCAPTASDREASTLLQGDSLAAIVRCYIQNHRAGAEGEIRFFADVPVVAEVIRLAAFARTSHGSRHPHHQRRTKNSLEQAHRALAHFAIDTCSTFEELINEVEKPFGISTGLANSSFTTSRSASAQGLG